MAKITRFEELIAWQKARVMTREIYRATESGKFARDFGLRDQVRRAAVSVMSNIAEGFERSGDREFLHFLSLAKGSCGEIRAQFYVALDQAYINNAQFQELIEKAIEISRLLAGLMKYLSTSGASHGKGS